MRSRTLDLSVLNVNKGLTQGEEGRKQKSRMESSKKRLRLEPSKVTMEKVWAEPSNGAGPPSCAISISLCRAAQEWESRKEMKQAKSKEKKQGQIRVKN